MNYNYQYSLIFVWAFNFVFPILAAQIITSTSLKFFLLLLFFLLSTTPVAKMLYALDL